jgi:DNA-binding TFAR19-related protein (PDSD5 family)
MDIEEIRAKRMAELQGQGGGQGGGEEIQKLEAAREHRVNIFNLIATDCHVDSNNEC